MAFLRLLVLVVGGSALLSATSLFVAAGDLIWVSTQDSRIYEVNPGTSNQNFQGLPSSVAANQTQFGQLAFSADAQSAYMTLWSSNSVVKVDKNGLITTFATGITNPTGIIRTSSGKLLVASYTDGKIYDITAGGNFAASSALAWGLSRPRDLLETSMGVYVAEQGSDEITNIGAGGDLTSAAAYATLISPTALAWYNNKIYAVSNYNTQVYEIASGGPVSLASYYAKGVYFSSLAVGNGKLYAGTAVQNGQLSGSGIWDISSYKSANYTSGSAIAYNLPAADSMLGAVPTPAEVQAPTPEPGTMIAGLALLAFAGVANRRLRQTQKTT